MDNINISMQTRKAVLNVPLVQPEKWLFEKIRKDG